MKKNNQVKWEKGKKNTLKFYYLKSRWKFEKFNRKFPLHDYFGPMIGDKRLVRIADLGAGIVSTTGNYWLGARVKLYPSDVLADEFNEKLRHKERRWGGYTPLFPVQKQDMEDLTYPDEFFDIVHCVNALDHCVDPCRAVKEMYRVCKPGGWIYLRHFPGEGENQKYQGMHLWNISAKANGDCLIWDKTEDFLLSKCVPGFKTFVGKELENEPDNMVISKLQK
jgi:ubiquinone/menaquinone biosynthesis C-methylase UbiE